MKRKLFLLPALLGLLLAGSLPLHAQPSQEELIKRRDKKMESEFLKAAPWVTDYDKALASAKKDGKLVFGYFTRSYSP